MIRPLIYSVLLWLIPFLPATAQSTNFQQQYLNAKNLFKEGKYKLASEAFKPLIRYDQKNPFSAYASFYYALCDYHEGSKILAKSMLLQIKQLYSRWNNMDELNYWLGKIYLESEDYNRAFESLEAIRKPEIKAPAASLKLHHLKLSGELDTLQSLYSRYPKDAAVAEALAFAIAELPLVDRDQRLLEALIDKHNLEAKTLNLIEIDASIIKDEYKVAVILPFMTRDLAPTSRRKKNQFVLDIYQGIQMAVDSLNRRGARIKLYAYDTRRDTAATRRLLSKPEMQSMDLIIGPIFSGPAQVVNQFSYDYRINVIHPLSSNSEVIGNNPFAFMYSSSNLTIAQNSAALTKQFAKNKYGMIFYSRSERDSAMAHSYKQILEKDSFDIIMAKPIDRSNSREILDILTITYDLTTTDEDKLMRANAIAKDSLGYVFIATNDNFISSKVVTAVNSRDDEVLVVGPESLLEGTTSNFEELEHLGVRFYAPNYIDPEKPAYHYFRHKYLGRYHVSPTKFAALGFDLMSFAGHCMQHYGNYFQLALNKQGIIKEQGLFKEGYDYVYAHDNKVVPIVKLEDNELKLIQGFKPYARNSEK